MRTPIRSKSKTPARASGATSSNRYATKWTRDFLSQNPVFSNESKTDALVSSIGQSIQPYDHYFPTCFPTIAEKFGLERFVPTEAVPKGSRGPPCEVDGVRENCHRACLPAFLYT